jgi:dienelactone hydrolase
VLFGAGSAAGAGHGSPVAAAGADRGDRHAAQARADSGTAPNAAAPAAQAAVGLRTLVFVDRSRAIHPRHHSIQPRTLVTYVRYPAAGAAAAGDLIDAPAAAGRPYPLVVFAHGFDVTPGAYTRLLDAWARAGFVVAAPVFPLLNANAPGGPDESDIVNQPADMSFVITALLKASASSGPLNHLIDPRRIAVAGHSDGAITALAVAYDVHYRDSRVRAAVILSGAELGDGAFRFSRGSPPLLAAQGTADQTNLPRNTRQIYLAARDPKFLLQLLGAGHLPPYSYAQPWLGIVEATTIAFLDRYLRGDPDALPRILSSGNVRGEASLRAQP